MKKKRFLKTQLIRNEAVANCPLIMKILKKQASSRRRTHSLDFIKEKVFCLKYEAKVDSIPFPLVPPLSPSKTKRYGKISNKFRNSEYESNLNLLNRKESGLQLESPSKLNDKEEKRAYFRKITKMRKSYGVNKGKQKANLLKELDFSESMNSVVINKYDEIFGGEGNPIISSIEIVKRKLYHKSSIPSGKKGSLKLNKLLDVGVTDFASLLPDRYEKRQENRNISSNRD